MGREQGSQTGLTRRQILKYGMRGGLAAALSSSLWLNGCGRRRWDKRPNILFILIDALRADHLGGYGHLGGHSPALDAIAAEAVVFERAIAQAPWTQPSMASLFCSRYPGVHKVIDYKSALNSVYHGEERIAVFNDSFVTLVEVLQQAGYATAAFIANPFIVRDFGFAQGFDHFDSSFAKNTTPGNVVSEAALAWLKKRDPNKPFFCFLHYMDVHGPYNAGPEFLDPLLDQVEAMPSKRRLSESELKKLDYLFALPPVFTNRQQHDRLAGYQEYWAARYDAGIRQADHHIGNLKAKLEQMGLWDDAYVIVTADHGESLAEHEYWDHGFSVHHPELHVPLFLRWPRMLAPGKRIRGTVRLIDLMPTLLDQLKLPKVKALQGRTLVRKIAGDDSEETVAAFAEGVKLGPEQQALYLGDWKLMITPSTARRQLYNVAKDPLEQNELSRQHKEKVKQLAQILQQQTEVNEWLGSKISAERVPLTPQQQERLRSLGYLK